MQKQSSKDQMNATTRFLSPMANRKNHVSVPFPDNSKLFMMHTHSDFGSSYYQTQTYDHKSFKPRRTF